MKSTFILKWNGLLFIGLALLSQGIAFGAERPAPADRTIVLDESQIKGDGVDLIEGDQKIISDLLPALSTSLPWEGEEEAGETNIAREIFRQLAQPDPAYFMEDRSKEEGSTKGD